MINVLVYMQEGIKFLNTWLEGERSIGFCKYVGKNTAELKPDEIRHCMMMILFKINCKVCSKTYIIVSIVE